VPVAGASDVLRAGLLDEDALRGLCVLLVEDDGDAREFFRTVLESQGAEVAVATSAAEALGLYEARRPDVLVSDIGLPGEDGCALLRKLREADPRRGDLPSLAVTAYAGSEDRARALLAGFSMCLTKQLVPEELVVAVARLGAARLGN
jgi:CheY-like chemotaxis protein